jgi:hypothetical protein
LFRFKSVGHESGWAVLVQREMEKPGSWDK